MTDTTTAAPPITLASALAAFHAEIASLDPEAQTRINYAINDLVPLAVDELTILANAELSKLPIVGGLAKNFADAAIAKAGSEVLAALVPPAPATAS